MVALQHASEVGIQNLDLLANEVELVQAMSVVQHEVVLEVCINGRVASGV